MKVLARDGMLWRRRGWVLAIGSPESRDRRLKRTLTAAAGVLLKIIAAAVLAPRSIDFSRYKSLVAELDLRVDRLVPPNTLPVEAGKGSPSPKRASP